MIQQTCQRYFLYANIVFLGWWLLNGSEFQFAALMVLPISTVVFWAYNAVLYVLDNSSYTQFRWQKKHGDYRKAVRKALVNQLLTIPFGVLFQLIYKPNSTISFTGLLAELAFYALIEEIGFYLSHRLLHRIYYNKIHKVHHEFTALIGVAAIYAHPIEHLLTVAPVAVGPLLWQGTTAGLWIWSVLVTLNIVHTHSGYDIWFMPDSRHHDMHHQFFTGNYAVFWVTDYLLGTDIRK